MSTIKEYIETSLFHYPGLYHSRFQVLEHLFCTLGNGVELDEDGYLRHYLPHPSTLQDPHKIAYDAEMALIERFARETHEMFKELGFSDETDEEFEQRMHRDADKRAQQAVNYNESYHTRQIGLTLYRWNDEERFQPFRKLVGCKCQDLEEQVRYFIRVVKMSLHEEINAQNIFEDDDEDGMYDDELKGYSESLEDWKANLDVVEKAFFGE